MEKKIRFLIERNKNTGMPAFDFQYELMNAVDFVNWLYPNVNEYEYELVNEVPESIPDELRVIPVGCIEFASEFFMRFHHFEPAPLNIPEILCTPDFVKREIFLYNPTKSISRVLCHNGSGKTKPVGNYARQKYFIKSNERVKDYSEFGTLEDLPLKDKWYFVSEVVPDIESEFRCFVYKDELVDIRQYAGDTINYYHQPRLDITLIKRMIEAYKGHSLAYTLDIGTHPRKGSFIIELHNFWSCGLYGFTQYPKLLRMTVAGFYSEIRRANK